MKKGSKAAKAWGLKMKRLRSGGSTRKRKTRTKSRSRKRKVVTMARRKYSRRRSSGMGLNKGTLTKVAAGMGISAMLGSSGILPAGIGYVIGGLPGAAGGFFGGQIKNMLSGVGGSTINTGGML